MKFAAATHSSISLFNASIASLQADYNPYIEPGVCMCACKYTVYVVL